MGLRTQVSETDQISGPSQIGSYTFHGANAEHTHGYIRHGFVAVDFARVGRFPALAKSMVAVYRKVADV